MSSNAIIKADDDLYADWVTNNGNESVDVSFNRMDHVVEYVVEVWFGVENFFPEQNTNETNHNTFHKTFTLYISPSFIPVVASHAAVLPVETKGGFPAVVQYRGGNYQDFVSPPPDFNC